MKTAIIISVAAMLAISAITILFPENKYKKHLMIMAKTVMILTVISAFLKSNINLDFSAEISESTDSYGAVLSVHDKIKSDIKTYVETAFDTKCDVEISETELKVYVSSGDVNKIYKSVKEEFGIECRVIKNEE